MAKLIDISMLGDKKLQRDLNRLGVKIGKKILRQAMRAEQKTTASLIKQKAPVDTGAHRDHIRVAAAKGQRRGYFGITIRTGTREELGIPQSDRGYYPIVLERGGKKKTGQVILARPHMGPAFDSRREAASRNVAEFIRRAVDAIWKGR